MAHPAPALAVVFDWAIPWVVLAATAAAQDLRLRDGGWHDRYVTDTARGRVVAIGTHGNVTEWDGTRWIARPARS